MKSITRYIPNTITSLNLLSGCLSIAFAFHGNLAIAGCFIFIAAIFDFFDGFIARLLKVSSPIGIQLDSLADMVSFGVAPSIILYNILYWDIHTTCPSLHLLAYVPFIIAIFSALRLAKFNIDTRQTESFLGLTTTACGLLIASCSIDAYYPVFMTGEASYNIMHSILSNNYVIIIGSITLSALLVSEIPMFSFKLKKPAEGVPFFQKYIIQIIFLIVALILIVCLGFTGISVAILLYILVSVIKWFVTCNK